MALAKSKPTKVGKSVAAFRSAHDKSFIVPNKISEALKKLGDGWEYEADFIRLAGISQGEMGAYRESFVDHVVTVGGKNPRKVWAGTKVLAEKLRAMVQ